MPVTRMILIAGAFMIVALLGAMAVSAITPVQAKEKGDCLETATSNADFSECYAEKIEAADAQLNKNWKIVADHLRGMAKKNGSKAYQLMLNEQRHWIRFKEKACEYYRTKALDFGREGAVIGYGSCQLGVIQDRVKYLENFLTDHQIGK